MTDTFRELREMPPSGILMTLHVGDNSPRRISTAMVDGVRTTLAEAVLVTEELTLVGKGFIAGGGTHTHWQVSRTSGGDAGVGEQRPNAGAEMHTLSHNTE